MASHDPYGRPLALSEKEKVTETTSSDAPIEEGESGHVVKSRPLARALEGRHMQMIAIGGSIGAGLFVGSGGALSNGGPGSLLIGFMITGTMLLFTVQALGELAVLYPQNGAMYQYLCRFIDPSWGCAMGWDYAIGWLTVLPFELTAASITIDFWEVNVNKGVWITVFFVALCAIQVFGVRGYGEVEYVLGMIKILACAGFIILGIIIDCGGVPTDSRGYIGAKYWHDPGAFRNGFKGFASVLVTAAFAFGGTELAGLAAAEAADPVKSLPRATKQVFWRIFFFYIVNVFIIGLIVPSNSEFLLKSTGANTKYSPFVLAIKQAGIKGLPSVFNAVITLAVLSVGNSCMYGSTRTFQALAQGGMAPKILAYVDRKGRPIPTIILQLAFGLLAFLNLIPSVGDQIFNWLLALSGLQSFFTWASICLAHIRFRKAWAANGRSIEELQFRAFAGVYGSYLALFLNVCCLIAQFYVAAWPIGEGELSPRARVESFFSAYLTAFVILTVFIIWKVYSAAYSTDPRINHRGWKPYIKISEIDILTGIRENTLRDMDEVRALQQQPKLSVGQKIIGVPRAIWGTLFAP
ncbi:putative amino acid transporter [Trichodelitschia bisporula]|uniref:Putative amino acid transporter n=1 Tax=Trichodelitschia bisporula TaxID=703511 RepID=A0A6G1I3S6_9PEZI|nr:putative amino acid transporter [Trichodelitschia bisporula]